MADDNILLNAPTVVGGKNVATFLDAGGNEHEKVIVEYMDDGTGQPQKVDNGTHPMPVTDAAAEAALASIAVEDFATHAAQIDNSQKTQVVDAAGNQVTVTGNKLDVNATFSGDIEIGAVELKNSSTDDRAAVINSAPTTEFGLVTRNIPSGTQPVSGTFFQATQPVSGTFFQATQPVSAAALPLPSGAATAALQTQPGVDIGDVTINNAAGAGAVNIQDGGNSITVDGTFFQATQPISAATLPLPSGAATSALQTQPGVDIGDVTINNASGGAAVNIQDGGNSITVDGTFFQATQPISAAALPLPSGAATAANQQTDALTDTELRATPVPVSGTVATGGLTDVQLRATPVPISGTVAVTGAGDASAANQTTQITAEQAIQAAVQIMDDWDESDRAKVNLIVGQAGIAAGTGVDGVTVPRVTLATNVALPAGNNNIGDVDIASIAAGTNVIGKISIDQATPGTTNLVALSAETTKVIGTVNISASQTVQDVGNVAHDAVDSGNPVKVGQKAISFGTNPTAVASGDRTDWYANIAGIPFMIGGHPNIVCFRATYTAVQTDTAIVTIAGGLKIVVTRVTVTANAANTVNVSVIVGFGTANTPTTTGVVLSHPGLAPGSGVVEGNGAGILGVGADNADLRITSAVPTGGSIDVVVSYFTIES